VSMTVADAHEAAASEGLTLVRANNQSGFKGVSRKHGHGRFTAQVYEAGGKGALKILGNFATAEVAALCYARHIGKEAAEAAAAAMPATALTMTAAEAREAAAQEGLTLERADTLSGFKCVCPSNGRFQAQVTEAGRKKFLGTFATAEQAALCYSRYMLGKKAAAEAAAEAAAAAAMASIRSG